MQAVLSRGPQNLGGSGSSSGVPRRSSSFLSIKRGKDRQSPSFDPNTMWESEFPHAEEHTRSASQSNSRSIKSKGHRSSPSIRSLSRPATSGSAQSAYIFPTTEDPVPVKPLQNPTQHPRLRSRTGPSGRLQWDDISSVPQLRFSGSSSTQHTETPPRTPVEPNSSFESFEAFPVLVAAPASGVETMDALVDGLNGGDGVLYHDSGSLSRRRFGVSGRHPLYQPPLPTPPPGVILGGGKSRRPKRIAVSNQSSDTDDDQKNSPVPASRSHRRPARRSLSRLASNSTIVQSAVTPTAEFTRTATRQVSRTMKSGTPEPESSTSFFLQAGPKEPRKSSSSEPSRKAEFPERPKTAIPSISEIIRNHAPPETKSRPSTSRSSSYHPRSLGHGTMYEDSEPERISMEEDASHLSRSSIDSVADEVQRTLRNQLTVKARPSAAPPSSFVYCPSTLSDNASTHSPRSDPGIASKRSSIHSNYPPSFVEGMNYASSVKTSSASQEVARYLHSTRLTTLLRLTRSPHASADNPLTVSLSDLGRSSGHPVVVFLGLGCVRHIMGLYDEMAEILNLRLLTIDRWGLGRTEPRSKSAKGIIEWASVVEEVLDILHIERCSVMAHSAGAPYALSFANKVPERIQGDICLLAPWVGGSESSGYRWLKYVPNGILKTAQAAEWKIQAWMIGKPPSISYEGIGYNADVIKSPALQRSSSPCDSNMHLSSISQYRPRPSIGSSTFSEYDDLRDFDGRFESRSTLGGAAHVTPKNQGNEPGGPTSRRKPSKGFLNRFKGSPSSPQAPTDDGQSSSGKRLKALRSMSSLKGRSTSKKSQHAVPQLPPSLQVEVGLGFSNLNWSNPQLDSPISDKEADSISSKVPAQLIEAHGRYDGRRSISLSAPRKALSMPPSPSTSAVDTPYASTLGSNSAYQAALGNALIAASHAESAKGTYNDLLQILNHDNHPWGFSYSAYPHRVKVWYGEKDEKIAEHAVRWMAKTMGEDQCAVKVVKGADHGLMYRSSVVVEVLEHVLSFWRQEW